MSATDSSNIQSLDPHGLFGSGVRWELERLEQLSDEELKVEAVRAERARANENFSATADDCWDRERYGHGEVILSIIETIKGREWLDHLLAPVREEEEAKLKAIRRERAQPKTCVNCGREFYRGTRDDRCCRHCYRYFFFGYA